MRKVGALVGLVAVMVAFGLFTVQASVTRGAHAANCDVPLMRAMVHQDSDDAISADLVKACEEVSLRRVGAGVAVLALGLVTSIALLIAGRPKRPVWDQANYRWADPS